MGEGCAPGAAPGRRKGPVGANMVPVSSEQQEPGSTEQGGQEWSPSDAEPSLLQIQNRKLKISKITL